MSKGLKTYNNLSKSELLEKLNDEFHIEKAQEESNLKYNAATGTLLINKEHESFEAKKETQEELSDS